MDLASTHPDSIIFHSDGRRVVEHLLGRYASFVDSQQVDWQVVERGHWSRHICSAVLWSQCEVCKALSARLLRSVQSLSRLFTSSLQGHGESEHVRYVTKQAALNSNQFEGYDNLGGWQQQQQEQWHSMLVSASEDEDMTMPAVTDGMHVELLPEGTKRTAVLQPVWAQPEGTLALLPGQQYTAMSLA